MTQLLYDKDWMMEEVRKVCGRHTVSAILAVPEHMHQSVLEYVVHGAMVGDFLTSVFNNDLKESAMRADYENQKALLLWGNLLVHLPASPVRSFGSEADVKNWQAMGGLLGLLKQNQAKGE